MYAGEFKLHRISTDYVNYLVKFDENVKFNEKNKRIRIYLGIGLKLNGHYYFIPLCSPDEKPKFATMNENIDFMKICDKDGTLLCVLNISSMIPAPESEITYVDFKKEEYKYSQLLGQEYRIIRKRKTEILDNAQNLYNIITKYADKNVKLANRCGNYLLLEQKMKEYISQKKIEDVKTE